MATLYQTCEVENFDEATGTCTASTWQPVPDSALLPPLTIAEAQSIAQAILLLWAVAYAFRVLIRTIQKDS